MAIAHNIDLIDMGSNPSASGERNACVHVEEKTTSICGESTGQRLKPVQVGG